MSDSRLEKFIYAICSMDVSDLPVPLSRIETLWNCLITGETPDFEPLSRNEKYLMAMLDRYDISNLPAPMSRGEKLLYKIAVGETDLSDVPGYLSRYEELLKYLIENGGISGGDFEYVLCTLNQSLNTLYLTAEKPVKSAILKGCTLVNLFNDEVGEPTSFKDYNILSVKENTKYIIFIDLTSPDSPTNTIGFLNEDGSEWRGAVNNVTSGISKHIIETKSGVSNKIRFHPNKADVPGTINRLMIIEYQEGMENWDIPYFEGMQSVKMPVLTTIGKNLFDYKDFKRVVENGGETSLYPINLESNTTYTFSDETGRWNGCGFFLELKDEYNNLVTQIINSNLSNRKTFTFTTNSSKQFYLYMFKSAMKKMDSYSSNFQIEKGSTATSYEPYKSNILTVNEDVTLRGIGEVKDTLDGNTGELTQRIGEVVLDGSMIDSTIFRKNGSSFIMIRFDKIGFKNKIDDTPHIISSKLRKVRYYSSEPFITGDFVLDIVGWGFGVCFANNETATKDEAAVYLNNLRPVTQGYLITPVIKTVDLTVVDQDNQPTQLGTFENVTHVSLVAENLIPEVELEVATRISTELASASPLMDDISTKQQQLNTTVDEQSENVDATMIATTEIYEETL